MSEPATYSEIVEYLRGVPAASPSWAEGLYSAGLTLSTIEKLIVTMTQDPESPLRQAEESMLGEEMLRINQERGMLAAKGTVSGKMSLKIRAVLSASEQTRVSRIVSGFCQPTYEATQKYGKNGHAVMNAVRRTLSAYLINKVPIGGTVAEVGPDLSNWMLSPTPSQWEGKRMQNYQGARPVIVPRDSVRVLWQDLARLVVEARDGFYSEDQKTKAKMMLEGYQEIFKDAKIQDGVVHGEYILSFDSNYDIAFSDMPVSMALCRSRAWHGVMVRAKGLTRSTRLKQGSLDLMGVNYRVNWTDGRIDFRHPECSAFGYSHNVWEYMKYEEHNGFVWTTKDCHYIYSKGPETTDELLFFSVVRVPKVHRLIEPRFVENPYAGLLEVTSLWAIGDEVNGVPTSFEKVVFHVDALNFSKVMEKRRALDHRGDLAITVALVRSTNVRLWLHGTPVSVNRKIEARLADATALVVEALVAEDRLSTNMMFDKAMFEYNVNLPQAGWLRRMLESVIDLRAVSGSIISPVMRVWSAVRATVIDKALSSLGDVRVGIQVVGQHINLSRTVEYELNELSMRMSDSECQCGEVAELRAAIAIANGTESDLLHQYLKSLLSRGRCNLCNLTLSNMEAIATRDDKVDDSDIVQTDSGFESGGSGIDGSVVSDVDTLEYEHHEVGEHWSDESNVSAHETRSMTEFIELEEYLAHNNLTEIRVDAMRIFKRGPVSDDLMREFCTSRTRHIVMEFLSGRCVKVFGPEIGVVGALYDQVTDRLVAVRSQGSVMYATVKDGYYYSCNRLKVWNMPPLVEAVNYALSYGYVADYRSKYRVTLGVPGAGKTYKAMSDIADRWKKGEFKFFILAVTKASAKAARKYGRQFGIPETVLKARVMTLDRYLIHVKAVADVVVVDEFPMVHIGKVDAAVSIAAAKEIYLYGDARQIPYDPFCAEFAMHYATLHDTVDERRVTFMPKSHRLSKDVCAMWLDQYPMIYPCDCCHLDSKDVSSLSVHKVSNLDDLRDDGKIRFHTYKQDERDELRILLKMQGDNDQLRSLEKGGLSTVHEDQGSTHDVVVSVRLSTIYDKNASARNPSLYNRMHYVLTDTTRHTKSYDYYTLCEEDDLICKRIAMSKDRYRLSLVEKEEGMGKVGVLDMLSNSYV